MLKCQAAYLNYMYFVWIVPDSWFKYGIKIAVHADALFYFSWYYITKVWTILLPAKSASLVIEGSGRYDFMICLKYLS